MDQVNNIIPNKILELDKVLKMIAESAETQFAKNRILQLSPMFEKQLVIDALEDTQAATKIMERFGSVSFSGVRDMDAQVKRAQAGAPLNMHELLEVGSLLKAVRRLFNYRFENDSEMPTSLDRFFEMLSPNKFLEDSINRCIITEDEMADEASTGLLTIRRAIKNSAAKIREILSKYISSAQTKKYLQDPIITTRSDRFVIPVKAEYKGMFSGMVHDSSASGATLFIEPSAVVELNNEIRILQNKEEAEIERILYELSALVAQFGEGILKSAGGLFELDFAFAKGNYAHIIRGNRPTIIDKPTISLKKARHPLISPDTVVPVDIGIGNGVDTLVITGPNTGGKTVCLKTLGLFALMTQCGIFIPASDESEIFVFSSIYADIGDEQSIEQSLSTFSAHMKNIVNIVKLADHNSLVLFDELGAGTDPVEGAALATAILEYVRQKGALIGATTHYSELKTYAVSTVGVENASLEFDTQTLTPTYRVLTGVPGRSNAFLISQRLGLLPEIIDLAQGEITTQSKRLEDVISNLEDKRNAFEKREKELKKLKEECANQKNELDLQNRNFEKEKEKIIKLAREESRRVIESVKVQSQALIEQLDEVKQMQDTKDFQEALKQTKSTIKSSINKMYDAADIVLQQDEEEQNTTSKKSFALGDFVEVQSLHKTGVIIKIDSENATVEIGGVKTKIGLNKLKLINPPKEKTKFSGGTSAVLNKSKLKMEIDIRGLSGMEAELELDKFIDDALISGIQSVLIIHGKGTGALRAAVHAYLKRHQSVEVFRLGTFGEGEMGVTIANLK